MNGTSLCFGTPWPLTVLFAARLRPTARPCQHSWPPGTYEVLLRAQPPCVVLCFNGLLVMCLRGARSSLDAMIPTAATTSAGEAERSRLKATLLAIADLTSKCETDMTKLGEECKFVRVCIAAGCLCPCCLAWHEVVCAGCPGVWACCALACRANYQEPLPRPGWTTRQRCSRSFGTVLGPRGGAWQTSRAI